MNTKKKAARLAGFLYLRMIVTLIVAGKGVRSRLIDLGDAAATAFWSSSTAAQASNARATGTEPLPGAHA